jgi:hypothetical protein
VLLVGRFLPRWHPFYVPSAGWGDCKCTRTSLDVSARLQRSILNEFIEDAWVRTPLPGAEENGCP